MNPFRVAYRRLMLRWGRPPSYPPEVEVTYADGRFYAHITLVRRWWATDEDLSSHWAMAYYAIKRGMAADGFDTEIVRH